MSDAIDLVRYGQRIRYTGPFEPTPATLKGLMNGHTCSIPFENLDVLMGRTILLDVDSLQKKLVDERRGGYCFEQNGLFLAVLLEIGFDARPIAGRVRLLNPAREIPTPRTHLFILVELEGETWVADVGVGGMSLTAPLRFDFEGEQAAPDGSRRIVREDGRVFHQALTGSGWIDVWETRLEPMPFTDREVANWFTSTHPNSNFRQRLVCARAGLNGERLTILNNEFSRKQGSTVLESRKLNSKAELLEVLQKRFEIVLPEDADFGPPGSAWPTA